MCPFKIRSIDGQIRIFFVEKFVKTYRELNNSRQFMGFTCLCDICKEENDELDEEQTAMQSKVVIVCVGFLSCEINHVTQLETQLPYFLK